MSTDVPTGDPSVPASSDANVAVPTKRDLVSIVTGWLQRQRPETVILCMIMLGGAYTFNVQVPALVSRYDAANTERLKISTDAYEKDQTRDHEDRQAQQRFIEEVLRNRDLRGRVGQGEQPVAKARPGPVQAPL